MGPVRMAALALGLLAALGGPAAALDGAPGRPGPSALSLLQETRPPGDAGPSWMDAWLAQPGMLGDWLGLRPALARHGIVPSVTWTTEVQGNPLGGRRQGLREFDELWVEVDVDLETLLGARGTSVQVSASQRSGKSLTDLDIGNVFNVAQVCCGATFRLVNVYLEQSLLDGRLSVRGGRVMAGDEFMASPLYGLFVQSGIANNPAGIVFNAPGMTTTPTATWGLRVRVEPVPQVYAMLGVFNGDPTLGDNDKHGVDWTMRGPLFAMAEIGYRLNQEKGSGGLPGNYKIGAYYDDGTYPDFLRDASGGLAPLTGRPPRTTRGKTGFYVLADQMVYRDPGAGSQRGLTAFAALVGAPDESTNEMPFFVNGGLLYRGLVPGRDDDVAAFGVVYGRFSSDLRRAQALAGEGRQDYEIALEWSYVVQVARWLQVQPDVQYIVRPGGTGAIRNALVLGVQVGVTF